MEVHYLTVGSSKIKVSSGLVPPEGHEGEISSQALSLPCACLCQNAPFLKGHQLYGMRAYPYDLILT